MMFQMLFQQLKNVKIQIVSSPADKIAVISKYLFNIYIRSVILNCAQFAEAQKQPQGPFKLLHNLRYLNLSVTASIYIVSLI